MHADKHNTDTSSRRIRSFVRREGRLTPAQQRALDELWPRYGLSGAQPLNPAEAFGRSAPVTLEIGFGNGAGLAEMAANDPDSDYIGIEVHRPGVGRLLRELEERKLANVRVFCRDALEVLEYNIPDASLDRVLVFFPDPWPKKKHHKRRIIQPAFIALVARKLKPGGHLHMATDWLPYAEYMLEVMETAPDFSNLNEDGGYSERPEYRPVTKFEKRGQRLGHAVRDIVYRRTRPGASLK